jgi:hypothetical protein
LCPGTSSPWSALPTGPLIVADALRILKGLGIAAVNGGAVEHSRPSPMPESPAHVDSAPPHMSGSEAPVAWRKHQQHLLEWFRREAPSLAEPYQAAVTLMSQPTFPARVHLICHIVRDIYTKLPEALDGTHRRREANEVAAAIDKVAQVWEPYTRESFVDAGGQQAAPGTSELVSVSPIAVRRIAELIEVRRAIKDQATSAEVLARALYQRFVEAGFTPPERLISIFETERRWFTSRAHLVRESAKVPTDDGLSEHFESFERTLHSLVAPHFTVQQELDDILQQANQ